jgi:hypothetical protein
MTDGIDSHHSRSKADLLKQLDTPEVRAIQAWMVKKHEIDQIYQEFRGNAPSMADAIHALRKRIKVLKEAVDLYSKGGVHRHDY